jgi:hypothetical protein
MVAVAGLSAGPERDWPMPTRPRIAGRPLFADASRPNSLTRNGDNDFNRLHRHSRESGNPGAVFPVVLLAPRFRGGDG